MTPDRLVLLTEVADVLSAHGALRCSPALDVEDGVIRLTLDVPADDVPAVELHEALRRLVDIGTLRGFALRYGVNAADLEAVLDKGGEA